MTASGAIKQVYLTSLQEKKQFSNETLEKLSVTYNDIQNTIDVQLTNEVSEQEKKQISDLLQKEMTNGELPFLIIKPTILLIKNLNITE